MADDIEATQLSDGDGENNRTLSTSDDRDPCRLCRSLHEFWSVKGHEILENAYRCSGCDVIRKVLTPFPHVFDTVCHVFGLATYGSMELKVWLKDEAGKRSVDRDPYCWIELYTSRGTQCPWETIPIKNHLIQDNGSDEASRIIKGLLGRCNNEHSPCMETLGAHALPTRIIEILGPTDIRLKITEEGETGVYNCLSYCWGDQDFLRTTLITVRAHESFISWTNLPKTFQDAINVTSLLGIRYLWIDSLCIIQDGIEDWRRESGKMASVYSQSYLTIAATGSPNPVYGLFHKTDLWNTTSSYDFQDSLGRTYPIHVRNVIIHHPFHKSRDERYPLMARAWAYQEQVLSPRTLHFGQEEMSFECLTGRTCEFGCYKISGGRFNPIKALLSSDKSKEITTWHQSVCSYAPRTLTRQIDIFPALQGIAKTIQSQRNCNYYAGIWEDNIVGDLLWYHRSNHWLSRPESWRAPSWSWASILSPQLEYPLFTTPMETGCSIVSIATTPVSADGLGELKYGDLILKGNCIEDSICYFEKEEDLPYLYTCRFQLAGALNGLRCFWFIWPDAARDDFLSYPTSVILLGLASGNIVSWGASRFFMMLKVVDGERNLHKRVGFAILASRGKSDDYAEDTKLLQTLENEQELLII